VEVEGWNVRSDESCRRCGAAWNPEEEDEYLDEDALLALEESLMEELEREAAEQALLEVERLEEEQNAADCELYEQHLMSGVPCPLCGIGRLDMQVGELRCTSCSSLRVVVMDEALTNEAAGELLGLSEERHRHAGCTARPCFEVKQHFGPDLLFLSCEECGWNEVVF